MEAQFIPLPTQPSLSDHYIDGSRGLLNPGNFSVKFVPLIAVMATMVPQILSRIKQMRPTQTVSGRGFGRAQSYIKEAIDDELCKNIKPFEFKGIPKFPDLYYSCELIENTKECASEAKSREHKMWDSQYQLIGKIRGRTGCFRLKIHKCPDGYMFENNLTTRLNNGRCRKR